jgi:hypothetical protein
LNKKNRAVGSHVLDALPSAEVHDYSGLAAGGLPRGDAVIGEYRDVGVKPEKVWSVFQLINL